MHIFFISKAQQEDLLMSSTDCLITNYSPFLDLWRRFHTGVEDDCFTTHSSKIAGWYPDLFACIRRRTLRVFTVVWSCRCMTSGATWVESVVCSLPIHSSLWGRTVTRCGALMQFALYSFFASFLQAPLQHRLSEQESCSTALYSAFLTFPHLLISAFLCDLSHNVKKHFWKSSETWQKFSVDFQEIFVCSPVNSENHRSTALQFHVLTFWGSITAYNSFPLFKF